MKKYSIVLWVLVALTSFEPIAMYAVEPIVQEDEVSKVKKLFYRGFWLVIRQRLRLL